MGKTKAIILAGGKGTRMKSDLPKVLHKIYDKTIIDYVYDACIESNIDEIYVIVGHKANLVENHLKDKENLTCILQKEQLGTGHAVMQAADYIENDDIVFVINADQALISSHTIKSLTTYVEQGNYGGAVLAATVENPGSLGRIIRDNQGNLSRIVERKDCNEDEEKVKEINVGVYCFKGKLLKEALTKLDNNNAQNEYYITDIPVHIMKKGFSFGVYTLPDISEYQGINSREELSIATNTLLDSTRKKHMANGVTLIDPSNTYISLDAKIGKDTIIYPGTNIQGRTIIGENCVIGPNSHIISSTIGNNVTIETSKVDSSIIQDNTKIGPFAHLRPSSNVAENCKIGSFVETKNSNIGMGTKVPHHIYLGDSDVGRNVEIACGTITANMNTNWEKNRTIIKDKAFIGCNSVLVAPVSIGENSIIAASSTITENVPANSLAISRERQTTKIDYLRK